MNGEEALPCLAADHHASIGMQYLAAHVAGIIARQEKEAGGDLIGLARPSHRCALARSEEHTSELQSLMRISYAVFCLKKKKKINNDKQTIHKQHLHK